MEEFFELLNSPRFATFSAVFVFVYGLLFGSFLNVCIYRIPLGKSIVFPPSSCTKCNHKITWYENIPVFSWIFLRGKCSGCGEKISLIYPVIELLNAFLYLAAFLKFGFHPRLVLPLYFISALVVTAAIDYRTQFVYSKVIIPPVFMGIMWSFFEPSITWQQSLIGIGVGAGFLLLAILLFYLVTRKIGMGLGDVYILAAIGAFTGPVMIPFILLIASLGGIIFYLAAKLIFGKKRIAGNISAEDLNSKEEKDVEHAIYFGPFLAFGGLVMFLLPTEIINSMLSFFFGW